MCREEGATRIELILLNGPAWVAFDGFSLEFLNGAKGHAGLKCKFRIPQFQAKATVVNQVGFCRSKGEKCLADDAERQTFWNNITDKRNFWEAQKNIRGNKPNERYISLSQAGADVISSLAGPLRGGGKAGLWKKGQNAIFVERAVAAKTSKELRGSATLRGTER